jgi:Mrp family chromosome partitioning ATPase
VEERGKRMMDETCNHQCDSCEQDCEQRVKKEPLHPQSRVKKVYAIMSGKGGVGKSLVTSLLAVMANRTGYQSAILDADITGPSIPKAFGIQDQATGDEQGIYPAISQQGVYIMSTNLLLPSETDPVVWRGPMIANMVQQFWTQVVWKDVDFLFIDMPPGTGDVPLTVFQSIPVDGIIVVTSPQDLVTMVVKKAIHMANLMGVPIIGLVENMSYFTCPDCGNQHAIFGESQLEVLAKEVQIPILGKLPIHSKTAALVDQGLIEYADMEEMEALFESFCQRVNAE